MEVEEERMWNERSEEGDVELCEFFLFCRKSGTANTSLVYILYVCKQDF